MDKVRVALDYVRKYHFWLLCVVAVVASMAGWMMARGSMSSEFTKRKAAILSKFSSLEVIKNNEFPPNDTWQKTIVGLTDEERKLVSTAWETVYNEQQKVLEWPEVLTADFKKVVMEWVGQRITQKKQEAEFPSQWRLIYRNEVANVEFKKLLAIIGAEAQLNEKAGPGGAAARAAVEPAAAAKVPPRVNWEAKSQQTVQKGMEIDSQVVPTSFEVWLKLEDLWVYRALLKTISTTNEGAEFSSRVKAITELSIGVDAAKAFKAGMQSGGHIIYAQAATAGAEAGVAEQGGASAEELAKKPIDEGRYVDANGNPLGGGVAHNEQFKRMPVYMRLEMDQREINRLLTACANSPLRVEVRQLRINPGKEDTGKKQQGGQAAPAADGVPAPTTPTPFDVTVEIHGLIYIYNPPDPAKLGQTGAVPGGVGP